MNTVVSERIHALDAVRAGALLLGIVLHATMSFFLPIPAQDSSQSTTLAVVFYVIHMFRMSLFFLLAGFFAHLLLQRRGVRGFVKDRAKRILVPMTLGWLVLAPVIVAIMIWGLSRTFPEVPPAAVEPQSFPLTHLWFLYYLCLFYALALVLRAALSRLDAQDRMSARFERLLTRALSGKLAPLLLGLPLFAVLYLDPAWPLWFGIPTPDMGLSPKLPAMVGFGLAFGVGWLLHRQTRLLDQLRHQWLANLLLAAGLTTGCLWLVGLTPTAGPSTMAGPPWHRLVYGLSYTVAGWYWVLSLTGAALRFCVQPSPLRRYLADASYWMYLAHLPVVFGLQVMMMDWTWHWSLKFCLILVLTLSLLLASYHWLVRPGFLGELLHGRSMARQPAAAGAAVVQSASDSPLAQLSGVRKCYGKSVALENLSFGVRQGELLALLGSNGAGKSTAIGLWLGTLQADAGRVSLMGGSPLDVHSRLGVGVMMQEVNLAPTLSAREHITLTASYYREPLSVDQTIALTGIGAFAEQRYGKLSGGQKRQVQFALAVCGRPQLLFLDEPTVGLDVQAREAIWRAIRALLDDGRAIVLTTHYLEEAEALADRVAVLAKGQLIAEGTVAQMRTLVSSKRIRCVSAIELEQVRSWPGVVTAAREARLLQVSAADAEAVVRRLLDADPALSQLEVQSASLAEALNQLIREPA